MPSISAVIITFNEEKNIERCLNSLSGLADEIVVVDSFSTDRTEELCKPFNVRFIPHAFAGHIQQKNYAKDCASNQWVLSLDADEALSQELKQNLLQWKEKSNPEVDGYVVNRLTHYGNKFVRHSGWYPDRKLRLWKKDAGQWGGLNPHDKFELFQGPTQRISGDLLHYSFSGWRNHLEVNKKFAAIAAKSLYESGKKGRAWKRFISPYFQFIQNFFFRLGFLDGLTGIRVCAITAYYTYLKYKLLSEME
ncbi:MAG: glycosyltransferase family 2 protein [Schleiferiaceae bacterium]